MSVNAYVILTGILLVVLAATTVFLYVQLTRLKKEKAALQRKQEEQLINPVLETAILRHKLNPHLLRNALNAIQSHAYQSYYALDKLSSVLDYILYESDGQLVSLRDELDFALNLIEINRIKTSPLFDLRVKNKIDPEHPAYTEARIAPFISINPIENAFKHADLQSEGAFISVTFELKQGWFLLSVSNKVSATAFRDPGKGGLGNKAFQNRLDSIYQNDYELKETSDGVTFNTILKIRLHGRDT